MAYYTNLFAFVVIHKFVLQQQLLFFNAYTAQYIVFIYVRNNIDGEFSRVNNLLVSLAYVLQNVTK